MPGTPASVAYCWSICQTTFSDMASPCTLSPRFTGWNTRPSAKPNAEVQASIATFTHVGIGTVRTRRCFPTSNAPVCERERRHLGSSPPEVSFKDQAATQWCDNATSLTGIDWQYRKVPQKEFEALRP